MAKKGKISLQRSEDFHAMDAQLTAAMEVLDETNARINSLLEDCRPAGEAASAPDQTSADTQQDDPPPEAT